MKNTLRKVVFLLPLLGLASCGEPAAPKEDPYNKYKPTEQEWTANIERIKTGNMTAVVTGKMGDSGTEVVNMKATATKVEQQVVSAGLMTQLFVKDGENYFCYTKESRNWYKAPSTAEDFNEAKSTLLPIPLEYSNFEWGGSTFKMTNKQPIVVTEGEGESVTFTNVVVSISPSEKQITLIEANVSEVSDGETQTGTVKVSYVYKDDTFDIDVPEVEG